MKQVVFENGNAPKKLLSTGPVLAAHEKCRITAYENDEMRLVAHMVTPGFLMMSEIDYPGWQLFVDGEKREIFTGYYLFRTVPLEEGYHEIHFVFRSLSFKIGVVISVAALLGAMILILFFFRKRKIDDV